MCGIVSPDADFRGAVGIVAGCVDIVVGMEIIITKLDCVKYMCMLKMA